MSEEKNNRTVMFSATDIKGSVRDWEEQNENFEFLYYMKKMSDWSFVMKNKRTGSVDRYVWDFVSMSPQFVENIRPARERKKFTVVDTNYNQAKMGDRRSRAKGTAIERARIAWEQRSDCP